jgi:hypothetical protein
MAIVAGKFNSDHSNYALQLWHGKFSNFGMEIWNFLKFEFWRIWAIFPMKNHFIHPSVTLLGSLI